MSAVLRLITKGARTYLRGPAPVHCPLTMPTKENEKRRLKRCRRIPVALRRLTRQILLARPEMNKVKVVDRIRREHGKSLMAISFIVDDAANILENELRERMGLPCTAIVTLEPDWRFSWTTAARERARYASRIKKANPNGQVKPSGGPIKVHDKPEVGHLCFRNKSDCPHQATLLHVLARTRAKPTKGSAA